MIKREVRPEVVSQLTPKKMMKSRLERKRVGSHRLWNLTLGSACPVGGLNEVALEVTFRAQKGGCLEALGLHTRNKDLPHRFHVLTQMSSSQ